MADFPQGCPGDHSVAAAHPDTATLAAFASGRLPEGELERIAGHLSDCASCRDYVEQVPGDALGALLRGTASGKPSRLRLQSGYEIIEVVGRGGMGVVYRARQLDLDRTVAFKQIEGDVSSEDLARFRAEASAMARLQHPNIVQVYDVGEQDEQPYIACEFLPAGGLDRYLSGQPLPVKAACRLVATLARAVHAAHEQSVVHRDLKPSNVLLVVPAEPGLGPEDERFWQLITPKIADFGLAKFLDRDRDRDNGYTRTGALLGTPAYMAPEQTGGPADAVGPRTDVYALGVILYETLTGRRPFQGSTVVETLDLVRTAEAVPLRRIRQNVPRDVQTICLKCLEKEPVRRYATAAELADDLDRWLAGEPIRGRPVPPVERCGKWLRRRPAWAALIVLAILTVASAAAGTFWHIRRLRAEVARANKSEADAMLNFRDGYETLDQIIREMANTSARSPAWRELNDRILAKSLEYCYGALKGADEANPDVQLAKGMLLSYAGSVHVIQAHNDQALDDLRRSRERLEPLYDRQPDNLEVRYHLASCYLWLGLATYGTGNVAEAEQLYRRAIELETELLASGAKFARLKYRLAKSHDALARLLQHENRNQLAVEEYEVVLALRREIAKDEPRDDENRAKFGEAANELVWLNLRDSKRERAVECMREAVEVLVGGEGATQSMWVKATLAQVYQRWALVEFEQAHPDEAVAHCDRAITKLREIQSQDPQETALTNLVPTLRMKAWCLSRGGRPGEAFAAWKETIDSAQGADRDFYRSERALERALVGDHVAATDEAAEVSLIAELPAHLRVHLARVYSRSLEALDQNRSKLAPADLERLKHDYTARGVSCLQRVTPDWLLVPANLAELDADPQLAALRTTDEYAAWRQSFGS
ncbi:MAG TPA: protein kinase [Pirellulales bacterium]|nr:protein kinase [Pirellulales bacterium]